MVGDTPNENKSSKAPPPKRVFTPTIPQRRLNPNERPFPTSALKETRKFEPNVRHRGPRNSDVRGGRGASIPLTASGPFAMGPTAASSPKHTGTSSSPSLATSSGMISDPHKRTDQTSTMEDIPWWDLKVALKNVEWPPRILEMNKDEEVNQNPETDTEKRKIETKVNTAAAANTILKAPMNSLHLIQMPPILPDIDPAFLTKASSVELDASESGDPASTTLNAENLEKILEGQIGQLMVRKSGKVQLKIGELLFDVAQLPPSSFLQEAVCMDFSAFQAFNLGSISSQLLCTPNLDKLVMKIND